MQDYSKVVDTMPGVMNAGDGAGTVGVLRGSGDTIVSLTVTDHTGTQAQVYLGWRELTQVMLALGAAGDDL